MKRSQGPRFVTGIITLKKTEHRLKTCGRYAFCKKAMASISWNSQGVLFIDFLIKLRIFNAAYYPMLLKGRIKASLSFKTTRSISQKRLPPPPQRASAHRRCDDGNTGGNALEDTATPPYSSDLASNNSQFFGPLSETLGGKRFRADDGIKFLREDDWTKNQ
jgi:hypothetical protein